MTRILDFAGAALGLLLLLPLLALIALVIRLTSGSPVFYRQVRVGLGGRPFRIWKFRTMVVGADRAGCAITVGGDARVTRAGAWLRRWKLDELPQLINVLAGDMAFVGPRPELPHFVDLYTDAQRRILDLRPGITDPASIAYRHENELLGGREDPEVYYLGTILPDKIRLSLEYAGRATPWRNLKVILATLGLLAPERV